MGISAWFSLTETVPEEVVSVQMLEASYETIFRDLLMPLSDRNPGRAIVFTEYGATDVVGTPRLPWRTDRAGELAVFADRNRNGLDDGEEAQANMFQAFFNTSERYPGIVNGAFFWDNWIRTEARWQEWWAGRRNFDIRGKLAEDVVRAEYARRAAEGMR